MGSKSSVAQEPSGSSRRLLLGCPGLLLSCSGLERRHRSSSQCACFWCSKRKSAIGEGLVLLSKVRQQESLRSKDDAGVGSRTRTSSGTVETFFDWNCVSPVSLNVHSPRADGAQRCSPAADQVRPSVQDPLLRVHCKTVKGC
jgi:hypothetical protein